MIKIKRVRKKEKIYDINVRDNHNFFANNILVHNCVESFSFSKAPQNWKEESNGETRTTTETNGLYHSCLVGETIIDTNTGEMTLKRSIERINAGETLFVKSYDINKKEVQYNKILAGDMTRKNAKLVKVKYNNKEIICTPDHKIFTENRGYVEAKDLNKNDILVLNEGSNLTEFFEIEYLDYCEDVYDIEVENTNNFFANGMLVHNCNLLSVVATNLIEASDELIEEVCYYAVLILDRSIDEGEMPVLEAKKMSELIRNIGIGLVGMGDMMAYNGMTYDTKKGQEFGEKFVEKISFYSYNASHKLAKDEGPYPLFKPENYNKILGKDPKLLNELSLNGFDWVELQRKIQNEGGIRNFYLLAFAPNSSSGILMASSASYLPVYNKEMVQTLDDLSLPIIPKYIDKNIWSYKTKFQYHPRDIIICTDKWQKWVDTGMSMEININPELCKINEISDTITDRMLNGDLKTVYYSLTIDGKKSDSCQGCAN